MRTRHLAAVLWWTAYSGDGAKAFEGKNALVDIVQHFAEVATRAERRTWVAVAKRLRAASKELRPLRITVAKPGATP